MSDLVARLRDAVGGYFHESENDLLREAADYIEELERQRDIAVDDAYNKPQNADSAQRECRLCGASYSHYHEGLEERIVRTPDA